MARKFAIWFLGRSILFLVFFGVLFEAQGIFWGVNFCPHWNIPVTWNPEYPPWGDQHEISPRNINALKNGVVMRIEYMVRKDESNWHFSKSPHYFYWKSIGTVNENLNFDIRVSRVKSSMYSLILRRPRSFAIPFASLPLPSDILCAKSCSWRQSTLLYMKSQSQRA